MKKEIQTYVALQLLSQKDKVTHHTYQENKIIETSALNIIESVKLAINEGLDIMLPLDENQIKEENRYVKSINGKITFIEAMMSQNAENKEIVNFLYNTLNKENIKNAHDNFASNIYTMLEENGISMKKMFEIGFDFQQGTFDEESKAGAGNLDFFECCLYYKKDFDFNYKYSGDFTLKEAVEDSLQYKKDNKIESSKEENLLNFIEKVMIKQKLESQSFNNHYKELKPKI